MDSIFVFMDNILFCAFFNLPLKHRSTEFYFSELQWLYLFIFFLSVGVLTDRKCIIAYNEYIYSIHQLHSNKT